MIVLFCGDSLSPHEVEELFVNEAETVSELGGTAYLIDYDALTLSDEVKKAIRHIPEQEEFVLAVYRGWMLSPPQYERLSQGLFSKRIELINSPAQYLFCHHLPNSYEALEGRTPESVWFEPDEEHSIDAVMRKIECFGEAPIVIKDYVKSCKHNWDEACYIPCASDRKKVEAVVGKFIELQGDDLNVNLVFRKFVEFEPVGEHRISGMPLTKEYRLFVLEGEIIQVSPYWKGADYDGESVPVEQFIDVIKKVKSRFFTLDIARTKSGEWQIIELGDGQVSGLPHALDLTRFYDAILNCSIPISRTQMTREQRIRAYIESQELSGYVLNYYSVHLTKAESHVLSYAQKMFLANAKSSERINQRIQEEFSSSENAQIKVCLKNGVEMFKKQVCARILKEHHEEVYINRCPSCERVVATPKAKQCLWCGYDWH